MRVALIATGEREAAPGPVVAGRSVVLRQFDFARACGIERVIAYGDASLESAQALRREAERVGIRHATIASAHALVPLLGRGDELLVLQRDVLPEAESVIAGLAAAGTVLSFPSEIVDRSGFERIDATRHWAGALLIPGELVSRLEQLGDDADPNAALLRIALQAHIPIEPLSTQLLAAGEWAHLAAPEGGEGSVAARLRRHAATGAPMTPSGKLAGLLLTRLGKYLSAARDAAMACLAVAMILLGAAIFAAWAGQPSLAFVGVALGVPALDLAYACDRMARAPFRDLRFPPSLRLVVDGAIFTAGVLVIEGEWHRQMFVPLVLVSALNSIAGAGYWRTLVGDRGIGALLVAGAALAGWQEQALMAWALAALAAALLGRRDRDAPAEE